MMKLGEAIKQLHDAHFPVPPEPVHLQRAARKILETWPELQNLLPDERDGRQILEDFLARIERWEWQGSTLMELNRAALLAFDDKFLDDSRYEPIRSFILKELGLNDNCSFIATAFRLYWMSWSTQFLHTQRLATLLDAIQQIPQRRQCLNRWGTLLDKLPDLFSPLAAPGQLAAVLLESQDVMQMRRQLGLVSLPLTGLQEEALFMWLRELGKEADTTPVAYQVMEWIETDKQAAQIPRLAAQAITTLVSPWIGKDCPNKIRQNILNCILNAYDDPRIKRSDPWPLVPEEIQQQLRHWLVGADMHLFLEIIRESEESHMWKEREEFWHGLYEEGRIKEAWVAFSDEAIRVVRRKYPGKSLSYGRQIVGGSRRGTSLLIMSIGNAIVVEGSHSYKVHVFCKEDPNKPKLYQSQYDCDLIRKRSYQQVVHYPGSWQRKVLQLIRECG